MTLTSEALHAALYVTSPVGRSTLVAHLEQRGYEVSAEGLGRAVAALGEKVSVVEIDIGTTRVPLWVLRGNRVG